MAKLNGSGWNTPGSLAQLDEFLKQKFTELLVRSAS